MIKREWILMALAVLSLMLAGCGGNATTPSTTAVTDEAPASADGAPPMQGELAAVPRDMLGIFKLEGTDLAVDADQAAALLPLWQAYRSLLNSDTTAPAELEALKAQLDAGLSAEQKDAIAAMNLTAQDMFAMAEQLGVTQAPPSATGAESGGNRPSFSGGGGPGGAGGPATSGGGGMPPAAGVMPTGPGGEGGFGFGGEGRMGEGFDPSMMMGGTPQPGQAAIGRQGDRFSQMLLDPLIELLKERAAA